MEVQAVLVLAGHAVYEAVAVLRGPEAGSASEKREEKRPQKRAFIDKTVHGMDAGERFFFLLEGEVAGHERKESIVQAHGGAGRGGWGSS